MIQWLIDAMNQVYDKMLERLSNEGPQETIQWKNYPVSKQENHVLSRLNFSFGRIYKDLKMKTKDSHLNTIFSAWNYQNYKTWNKIIMSVPRDQEIL